MSVAYEESVIAKKFCAFEMIWRLPADDRRCHEQKLACEWKELI